MLKIHRAVALIPILSMMATGVATGQVTASNWDSVKALAPGTEVRVTASNSPPVRGTLDSVTDASLAIRPEKGTVKGTRSFARPEVRSISVKKKRHRLRKVLIGAGVGAGAGLGIGAAVTNDCGGIACQGVGVVLGGLIGLVGGVVAGLVWSRSEWRQVYAQ